MQDQGSVWRRPRVQRAGRLSALGLLGALTLAGCTFFGADPEPEPPDCPTALLLDGADRLVAYEPGRERSETAIRHVAALSGLETTCRRAGSGLEVDLSFAVVAEAGPAFEGGPILLDLFVATVRDGRVLGRQRLDTVIEIEAAGGRAGRLEKVAIAIPAPRPDQRIYVGFELDPDSLRERRLGRPG